MDATTRTLQAEGGVRQMICNTYKKAKPLYIYDHAYSEDGGVFPGCLHYFGESQLRNAMGRMKLIRDAIRTGECKYYKENKKLRQEGDNGKM